MNLQARLYDPTIGRFLSVDPLFEMQIGINPYHYCGNDPVNYSDPSGLSGTGVYFRSDDYTSEGKRIWYEIPRSETVTVIGGQKSASEINSLNAYNMNQSGNECYNGVNIGVYNNGSMKGGLGSGGGDSGGLFIPWQNESNAKAVQNVSNISDALSISTTTVSSAMDYVKEYEKIMQGKAYLGRWSTRLGILGLVTSGLSLYYEYKNTGKLKNSSIGVAAINGIGTGICILCPVASPFIGAGLIVINIIDISGGWEWLNE